MEIKVQTGSEWHSSYGAYGQVKLYQTQTQTLKHHYETSRSDTDWDETIEIGSGGKHGKWMTSYIELDEGQLIYVEGAETYKGRPSRKACGWFRAVPNSDKIHITAPDYAGRRLEVVGHLERLSYAEMKELDLPIKIRSSKHLEVCIFLPEAAK